MIIQKIEKETGSNIVTEHKDIMTMVTQVEQLYNIIKKRPDKIDIDSLLDKLCLVNPLPGDPASSSGQDSNLQPGLKSENLIKQELSQDSELPPLNQMSDRYKQLLHQKYKLLDELDDKNAVLQKIVSQYREIGMELNALTWSLK